jgi:hypothetical protein
MHFFYFDLLEVTFLIIRVLTCRTELYNRGSVAVFSRRNSGVVGVEAYSHCWTPKWNLHRTEQKFKNSKLLYLMISISHFMNIQV